MTFRQFEQVKMVNHSLHEAELIPDIIKLLSLHFTNVHNKLDCLSLAGLPSLI
jgi:hypothetical protein